MTLLKKTYQELDIIERHLLVLKKVMENEPIGIVKLSEETGLDAHKVRYSLRVLGAQQLIQPSTKGAIVGNYTKDEFLDFEEYVGKIIKKIESVQKMSESINNLFKKRTINDN